jgi:hypothetical protein
MPEHFGDVANALFVPQNCLLAVECQIPEVAVSAEGIGRQV